MPNTAFIIFSSGAFGGAEKRFTNLFIYLRDKFPGRLHYIINPLMQQHIQRVFPGINDRNIHVVDTGRGYSPGENESGDTSPKQYQDNIPDPYETDKNASVLRKYYWFYKNKAKQKKIFDQIEEIRVKENIKVLIGIFAGGIPLMFYREQGNPDVKIIFSDMDSWFSEVIKDTKKLWYRKYYSFNYIMENADKVDFLSPYIAEGVKKLGVKISPEKIAVAPCSFIDYTKCFIGAKSNFEIAFASRLEPDKNPVLYLEAAHEILKDYPDIRFHLLGEGSLVSEVEQYIKDNDLSGKVNFAFHKDPAQVFKETTVFVSLQTGTNYPSQSVLEAMACGNAVIASDTGDTGLFINQDNGILVNLTKDSIVTAIKNLIAAPEKAKQLGINAAKFVRENQTIEKVSEYYTGLIKNVTESGVNE